MFKDNWEKSSAQHIISADLVEKTVKLAYPNKKLIYHELISGGCANLNVKIQLKNETKPLLLRIYLRDRSAALKEQKLGILLEGKVPIPISNYIGEVDGYHFAITQFIAGIELRKLLLENNAHDINSIMFDVGKSLAIISSHTFPTAGLINKNFEVIPLKDSGYIISFAQECLLNENVLRVLDSSVIQQIKSCPDKLEHLLLNDTSRSLVHGDFDPANILVDKVDGAWKITGILDWEFTFSGSILWDMANMLRYAHKMPDNYQNAFLKGLKSNGVLLPEHWSVTCDLLNLVSLLDLLSRTDISTQPKRREDIAELINHISHKLVSYR